MAEEQIRLTINTAAARAYLERMMTRPEITIPDDAWEPNDGLDDPRTRLLTSIVINGLSMHLEAWQVHVHEDTGFQELVDGGEEIEHLYQAVGAEGHMSTVEIAGREYILVASPYC